MSILKTTLKRLATPCRHFGTLPPTFDNTFQPIRRRNRDMSNNTQQTTFNVTPVPCLKDNYAYILYDKMNNVAALVDPVEPTKVLKALKDLSIPTSQVQCILTTHRHNDHAGGNTEIAALLPHAKIYGGKLDECDAVTDSLRGNEVIELGSTSIKCLLTPCHTRGHICYLAKGLYENEPQALFSGDTLFIGGCGRLFEGTAEMMYHNITGTLAALDDSTKVYSGHEYTMSNLLFGLEVAQDANNAKQVADISSKIHRLNLEKSQFEDQVRKEHNLDSSDPVKENISLPVQICFGRFSTQGSTIGEEKDTNVFMMAESAPDFAAIRTLKDGWKGPRPQKI